MGYIKSSLSGEEKLLDTFSVHWFGWVWSILLSFILIGIPGLLRLIGTEMGITSKRIIYKTGTGVSDVTLVFVTDPLKVKNQIESISE